MHITIKIILNEAIALKIITRVLGVFLFIKRTLFFILCVCAGTANKLKINYLLGVTHYTSKFQIAALQAKMANSPKTMRVWDLPL